MIIHGIGTSKGISIGRVFKLEKEKLTTNKRNISDIEKEIDKLKTAVDKTEKELEDIRDKAVKTMDKKQANIFNAHIEIVKDPQLYLETVDIIKKERLNAPRAFERVVKKFIDMFENIDSEYMRERAKDIVDVTDRVLTHLLFIHTEKIQSIEKEVIIVAKDITPSDTLSLDKRFVKGFVTEKGSKTSHSSIIARSLEIPSIVSAKGTFNKCKDEDIIIIDGETGKIILNPGSEEIKLYKKKEEKYIKEKEELNKYKNEKSITKDGRVIEVAGNISSYEDVERVINKGGDSIGLYRTEYLFMGKSYCPTEEEQFYAYKNVLKKMKDKPVIIRTLDIGGDKDISYMKVSKEHNPFLGHRAIRLCLEEKDIFKEQMRALLRASMYGNLKIMFPMISTIEEFRQGKEMFEKEKINLRKQGKKFQEKIELGMMVEVPSAALMAHHFAKEADFFSIGTNDLIQYTFAADRMNEKVSHLYQPYHPSLLRLIKMIIDASHKEGKWTGICGEMAGNEKILPLLIGLGIDELSMNPGNILIIKRLIKKMNYKNLKGIADEALKMKSNEEVKSFIEKEVFNNLKDKYLSSEKFLN